MKKPEEIKKGLERCMDDRSCTGEPKCPYNDIEECVDALLSDALALIQQMEAKDVEQAQRIADLELELAEAKRERDALYSDLSTRADACDVCKHGPLYKNDCEEEFGDCGCAFEWRGVCPQNTEEQDGK